MTQIQNPPATPSPEALRQGYEPSVVHNRGLLTFFACFTLMLILVWIGTWYLLKVYLQLPHPADVQTSDAPVPERFPTPNLQPTEQHPYLPWQDLAEMREQKAQLFQQMGWPTDAGSGLPAIPDQIVDEMAQRKPSTREVRP